MVYIVAWVVLGVLLSFIVHAALEMSYIQYALSHDIIPLNQNALGYGYCALPVWLQTLLIIAGVVGGYFAGTYFWRIIYVEKRFKKRWGFPRK